MSETRDYELREYRPGDEESIVSTFNLVFRGPETGLPLRTLAEWRWQFLDNPGGWRIWLGLHEKKVVAQQSGLGYRVRLDGRDETFSQAVDSMVHPEHRGGLRKPSLFVQVGTLYNDAYAPRDISYFGWPNAQARRVGKAFLKYNIFHTPSFVVRELAPGAGALPREVVVLDRFDESVRALWERCAAHWGACVVRDERFLNWRFRDHPLCSYDLLGVREGGALVGYAVARKADWPGPGLYVVADWLVPEERNDVAELLRRALEARAREQGGGAIVTLFPEWSPWFDRFQRAGFLVWRSDCTMAVQPHDARYDAAWMREHWWYQIAESDYV